MPENATTMKVVLSTFGQIEAEDVLLQTFPDLCNFHPNMLHLVRKDRVGKNRVREKEPVPNVDHWKLELIVREEEGGRSVFVKNVVSERDKNRAQIIPTDFLFKLEDRSKIVLGKNKNNLNLVILIPKTDLRSASEDVSLGQVLDQRIPDAEARDLVRKHYAGKNSVNLKKMQIKVDVIVDEETINTGVSTMIVDKSCKKEGSLDIKYVKPNMSCVRGGCEVLVVTEHKFDPKSVEPRFQLFDEQGNRHEGEEAHVSQPKIKDKDDRTITFFTPEQNSAYVLPPYQLRLILKRTNSEVTTPNGVIFSYKPHGDLIMDQAGHQVCVRCLLNAEVSPSSSSLPPRTGPGVKRRRVSAAVSPPSSRNLDVETSAASTSSAASAAAVPLELDLERAEAEAGQWPTVETLLSGSEDPGVYSVKVDAALSDCIMELPKDAKVKPLETLDPGSSLNTPEHSVETLENPFHFPQAASEFPPEDLFQTDGGNPRRTLRENLATGDGHSYRTRDVRTHSSSCPRNFKHLVIKCVFGDDTEALKVFGLVHSGQTFGFVDKVKLFLRHYPNFVFLLTTVSTLLYFFPDTFQQLGWTVVIILTLSLLLTTIYQNLMK